METREEYEERVRPKFEFEKRYLIPEKKDRVSVPVDPEHPLVGASPRKRILYQIEMLEVKISDAKASGVRGENLSRWVAKLEKQIERKKELLEKEGR